MSPYFSPNSMLFSFHMPIFDSHRMDHHQYTTLGFFFLKKNLKPSLVFYTTLVSILFVAPIDTKQACGPNRVD